ncbi:hypothetical protein R3P38DRAFT_942039 [Favolaschia claudopus]|uniref:Uncharacterized protein n=1 Tax=Favolaschia claudopus TaxID=2862362 RepID=A0AAW0BM20_9AGAR
MDLFDHIFFQAAAVPALDMPMLEEFSIEYSHTMHAFYPYGAIQPMLCLFPYCSHPCSGVYRAMAGPFDPPFDIGSALEQFPDLVELSLDIPNLISNTLISRLVPRDGKLPLAPKLERIHFPNRSLLHKDCLWQTLVDMLYARFCPTVHGVSRLHTFEFPTDKRSHDVDVVAGLKTLRKRHHWNIKVGFESVFPAWNEWRT